MRLASEIILELDIEQKMTGLYWPHPWDHYPFIRDNACIWLRYQDLDNMQRDLIRHALVQIDRRLSRTASATGLPDAGT